MFDTQSSSKARLKNDTLGNDALTKLYNAFATMSDVDFESVCVDTVQAGRGHQPTKDKIAEAITNGQLTGEQIAGLKQLEMKLKAEEQDRGFKYAELEFKDRADARQMAVQTGAKTPAVLTWLIVAIVLGLEGYILFEGTPEKVSEIVMGRILGTLDMCLVTVLSYWFGTTYGSSRKTDLLVGSK